MDDAPSQQQQQQTPQPDSLLLPATKHPHTNATTTCLRRKPQDLRDPAQLVLPRLLLLQLRVEAVRQEEELVHHPLLPLRVRLLVQRHLGEAAGHLVFVVRRRRAWMGVEGWGLFWDCGLPVEWCVGVFLSTRPAHSRDEPPTKRNQLINPHTSSAARQCASPMVEGSRPSAADSSTSEVGSCIRTCSFRVVV